MDAHGFEPQRNLLFQVAQLLLQPGALGFVRGCNQLRMQCGAFVEQRELGRRYAVKMLELVGYEAKLPTESYVKPAAAVPAGSLAPKS